MNHDYMLRNGVTEQTRWLRQQTYQQRHAPFDFELVQARREHLAKEVLVWVGVAVFVFLSALLAF